MRNSINCKNSWDIFILNSNPGDKNIGPTVQLKFFFRDSYSSLKTSTETYFGNISANSAQICCISASTNKRISKKSCFITSCHRKPPRISRIISFARMDQSKNFAPSKVILTPHLTGGNPQQEEYLFWQRDKKELEGFTWKLPTIDSQRVGPWR